MIAGRYALDREIGRGGMGAVWLARDEVLGRPVALKRVGSQPGPGSAADLARAEREARLAARLNHPHVVAVFDLARDDGQLWLVMEYVQGSTLADAVRKQGPLPHDRAAGVLAQVADALAAAHATGIVHRDVKPSNILISPDDHVKLSDFGIARAETEATLTETGFVTGSPSYLAPEVASGDTATDASDVWSLGATLFHALSGRPPYEVGDNLMGALYRIVHEEPPRLPDAGWLAPLLRATMTKDPAERWPMSQVRDFLAAGPEHAEATRVLAQPGAPAPDPAPRPSPAPAPPPVTTPVVAPVLSAPSARARKDRRSSWVPMFAAVAVVALLAVVVLALVTRGEDSAPPAAQGSDAGAGSSRPSSPTASPPERPTARGMAAFVEEYLRTASRDPEKGFRMLTRGFQQESGELAGYTGFWGDVERVSDIEVEDTDVEAMRVAYTYTYRLEDGSSRTERVELRLEYLDGRYLIDGEA